MEFFSYWDQVIFEAIQTAFRDGSEDLFMLLLAQTAFWLPLIVFGLTLLYYHQKAEKNQKHGFFALFFGLMAFLLSHQLSTLLAQLIYRPAPYVVEYAVHQVRLSGYSDQVFLSLPDPGIAALAALATYMWHRLDKYRFALQLIVFICGTGIILGRIFSGYSYPSGIAAGTLSGMLAGWLIHRFYTGFEHNVLSNG